MKTTEEYLAIGSQLTASEFDKGKSVGLQNTLEFAMAEYNKDISILIDKKKNFGLNLT